MDSNLIRLGICVKPNVRAKLDALATAEDLSTSHFVRRMIDRHLFVLAEIEAEDAQAEADAKVAA